MGAGRLQESSREIHSRDRWHGIQPDGIFDIDVVFSKPANVRRLHLLPDSISTADDLCPVTQERGHHPDVPAVSGHRWRGIHKDTVISHWKTTLFSQINLVDAFGIRVTIIV
jgi:hypothetical protein